MNDEPCLDRDVPRAVATGRAAYYLDRLDDFQRRCPAASPPSYYAEFGNKCLGQFLATKPKLSPRGQRWIDDTLALLQESMEQERSRDHVGFAALERDDEAFRDFAFGTHAQAYLDAGVFELGPSDLWKVARTPDVSDLLSDEGLKEIVRLVLGGGADLISDTDEEVNAARPGLLARIERASRRVRSVVDRVRPKKSAAASESG